jgi:hypothetical protein
MRAVQLTAYGNPVEGLKYVDIPAPEVPGPNQVLIGVGAFGPDCFSAPVRDNAEPLFLSGEIPTPRTGRVSARRKPLRRRTADTVAVRERSV